MFDFSMYCTLQWLPTLYYTLQCLTLTCIVLSKVFCFSQYFLFTCIVFFSFNIIVFLLCLPLTYIFSQLFASYSYFTVFFQYQYVFFKNNRYRRQSIYCNGQGIWPFPALFILFVQVVRV